MAQPKFSVSVMKNNRPVDDKEGVEFIAVGWDYKAKIKLWLFDKMTEQKFDLVDANTILRLIETVSTAKSISLVREHDTITVTMESVQ